MHPKQDRDGLLELANWLQEEYGPVTETEHAAAFAELEDLDAEHERRRPAMGSARPAPVGVEGPDGLDEYVYLVLQPEEESTPSSA